MTTNVLILEQGVIIGVWVAWMTTILTILSWAGTDTVFMWSVDNKQGQQRMSIEYYLQYYLKFIGSFRPFLRTQTKMIACDGTEILVVLPVGTFQVDS